MPNQESTFYNVMPEVSGKKPISTPTPAPVPHNPKTVNAAASEAVFNTGPVVTKVTMDGRPGLLASLVSRKAIIIPVSILLLGGIGAGVWLFLQSQKTDEVANNEPIVAQPETTANPDVTTPGDWLARFFGSETCTNKNQCGDSADIDRDGLTNKEEYDGGTDPNNPDSDSDGIADGDEYHIFKTDPLLSRTYREGEYTDADFVKGSYDIKTNTPYTPEQLAALKATVKERGLHQPTLTTIGELALSIYDFQDPETKTLTDLNIDVSPQAKLDRDTQRQSTIKKIGGALIKYKAEKKTYPLLTDFILMSDEIAAYNTVATNYNDPINKERYVYGYEAAASGNDFTLTYYSETQNQLIKYMAKNAEETAAKENAQVNNDQRITDLENLRSALMVYSSANIDSNSEQINVFPTKEQFPSVLLPRYITEIPKDPNGAAYEYEVSAGFDTFTLKAVFQNPPTGVTGYVCNPEECKNY